MIQVLFSSNSKRKYFAGKWENIGTLCIHLVYYVFVAIYVLYMYICMYIFVSVFALAIVYGNFYWLIVHMYSMYVCKYASYIVCIVQIFGVLCVSTLNILDFLTLLFCSVMYFVCFFMEKSQLYALLYIYSYINICIIVCICSQMSINMCMHIHIHMYIHMCMHTYLICVVACMLVYRYIWFIYCITII